MIRLVFLLSALLMTKISLAQVWEVPLENGEQIRLRKGSIWDAPTSKSKALVKGADITVAGGLYDRLLTLASDSVINNYIKVKYYTSEKTDSIGWVYSKNMERHPVPYHILTLDTLELYKYLSDFDWKKQNDSQSYNKLHHAKVYEELAAIHFGYGEFAKAVFEFTKALSLGAKPYSRVKRAFAKAELGDYSGAIIDLNTIAATPPDHWTEATCAFCFDSWTIEYSEVDVLNSNGYYKFKLKRYLDAIADFSRSLCLSKENPEAYYYRAFCYLNVNKRTQACSDLSKAGEQGHKNAYQSISKYCNH